MTDLRRQQRRILTRTFFTRLFESELMPPGLPQVRLVTSVIAGIAAPLTVIPVLIRLHPSRLVTFQYTISMIALAFIALVVWEGIFPDRRDARILSALPIRNSTFVIARLGALGGLFGLFAIGSAILPSLAFMPLGNPLAHFIGLVALDAFAFFAIVALQCILLNVVGRVAAQRLAIVLQLAIVIVVAQLPILPTSPRSEANFVGAAAWWLPSMWFAGLFEVLSGRPTAPTLALAGVATASAVGVPLLTALLYAATYRRLLRRALEGEPPGTSPGSLFTLARATAKRVLVVSVPNAVSRAVCMFTLQTIARSRQHKMLLAVYVGIAVALVLSAIVPRALQKGLAGFSRPDAAMLSTPLVMIFLTLVGVRSLIRIPVEIKSNWVFRLREPAQRAAAVSGIAAAMIIAGVVPVALLAFGSAWLLWGPGVAVRHAAFCTALGVLLTHALLIRFNKFPFTCTYYPGSSRMRVLWPFYLSAFTTYSIAMARVEERLLPQNGRFIAAILIISALGAAMALRRRFTLRKSTGFRFEERDPDTIEGFNLSEMVAAERAQHRPAPP
jgi:phage shock protein PspC (stress-responsive transcriptional regulator)